MRMIGSSASSNEQLPRTKAARRQHRMASIRAGASRLLRWLMMQLIGWALVALIVLALLAEGAMLVLLLGERDYTNRIYPHIQVRGLDLSNLPVQEAREKLQEQYAAFLQSPICLHYQEQQWCPNAEEIGVSLDTETVLRAAMSTGRGESRLENTRKVAAIWQWGRSLPLPLQIDQRTMQKYLLRVAREIERSPRNAGVSLNGADIVVTSARAGVQVLVDETLHDMTAALQSVEPAEVAIRTRSLSPAIHNADIQPIVSRLEQLLSAPIVLTSVEQACHGPCRWEWSPEHLATWIHLVRGQTPDGHTTTTVTIDQTAIRNALVPIAKTLRREGTLPRLNWNNGQLTILKSGLPGRGLDVVQAHAAINEALSGGPRVINLPMVNLPPPINEMNLSTLRLEEPLSTGVSSFRASQQYRITNIRAGASHIHGLLIPPGEEFSFNDNLGPVDARGGFVQGAAIVDNRTQQEWGGGLCQVSTTMFRAAFWGGLPITERHEHQFRIGWYEELGEPPGLDAAIYTGGANLRFVNDTGGWLLIQSWPDLKRQRLYITLYGSKMNRHVEMGHRIIKYLPKPKKPLTITDPSLPAGTFRQTDYAQPGLVAEVYRNVWEDGELVRQETFPTTFEPWPDVFVRGTGRR
jgi:vancomycin resistance protein YoaR